MKRKSDPPFLMRPQLRDGYKPVKRRVENQMETLFILTFNGLNSKATRDQFTAGLTARGATVKFGQSRLGDFEVVKVNGQAVARAFKSATSMLDYMAGR